MRRSVNHVSFRQLTKGAKTMTNLHRDDNGKLPAYAWPGGYPIYYLCADGGCLCPKCANGENGSEAYDGAYVPEQGKDWHLVAQDIHYEGAPLVCDHCAAIIESAYGDPEEAP
jgi:hypothetical protein